MFSGIKLSIRSFNLFIKQSDLENLQKSENLKKTSESQGIWPKSQGICDRILKVRESRGFFFIFSQVEEPNLENFLNGLRLTVEFNFGLERQKISCCLESNNPV